MRAYDVTDLVNFAEQPDGSMSIEPKRPSPPGPTASLCAACHRMQDFTGNTYGWGLCHCGSFRFPVQP